MKTISENATMTVAVVNGQQIQIIQNDDKEKLVPVRPICDALGIDYPSQFTRLKRDEILSSTVVMTTTVGADQKDREMICLPFKFVFGWLFTLDTSRVKPEAKNAVIRYQLECYDALYNHFTGYAEYVEWREAEMNRNLLLVKDARREFNTAKDKVKEAELELDRVMDISWDDYRANKKQTVMQFPEEGGSHES